MLLMLEGDLPTNLILSFNKNYDEKSVLLMDFFSIITLNIFLNTLLAFTIYFCFLHSVRHSISLMSELDRDDLGNGFKIFVKKALPLTIITAIFCAIGLYLLNNTYNLESSILKIIFIVPFKSNNPVNVYARMYGGIARGKIRIDSRIFFP